MPGGFGERYALLALLMVTWGSAPALASVALQTFSPFVVVAGRLWLAAAVLLLALHVRGRRLPRDGRAWLYFSLLGLVGNALPFSLIMYGQLAVPSGVTAVCLAAMPIVTLLLAAAFVPDEPLTPRRSSGFLVAFGGVLVLLWPSINGLDSSPPLVHFAAVLGGASCYAAGTVLARLRPPMDAPVSATGTLLVAAFLITPAAAWSVTRDGLAPDGAALAAVVALGLWTTIVPTLAFFRLIGLAGAAFTAQANYLVPVWGFILGVAVVGEPFRSSAVIALALLLAGMVLAERRSPRPGGTAVRRA